MTLWFFEAFCWMSKQESYEVAGVDGCRGGWCVAVALPVNEGGGPDAGPFLALKSLFLSRTFAEVLAETDDCELVCVDIPIGLPDGAKARECGYCRAQDSRTAASQQRVSTARQTGSSCQGPRNGKQNQFQMFRQQVELSDFQYPGENSAGGWFDDVRASETCARNSSGDLILSS
jgi:hypothetical protein